MVITDFLPKRKKCNMAYQKKSIATADRHNENIEDWEIETFIQKTSDEFKDDEVLFELARQLGRTFNAMMWWYELTYNSQKYINNTHGIDLINRFAKFRGTKDGKDNI